jgi:hypothetical protein
LVCVPLRVRSCAGRRQCASRVPCPPAFCPTSGLQYSMAFSLAALHGKKQPQKDSHAFIAASDTRMVVLGGKFQERHPPALPETVQAANRPCAAVPVLARPCLPGALAQRPPASGPSSPRARGGRVACANRGTRHRRPGVNRSTSPLAAPHSCAATPLPALNEPAWRLRASPSNAARALRRAATHTTSPCTPARTPPTSLRAPRRGLRGLLQCQHLQHKSPSKCQKFGFNFSIAPRAWVQAARRPCAERSTRTTAPRERRSARARLTHLMQRCDGAGPKVQKQPRDVGAEDEHSRGARGGCRRQRQGRARQERAPAAVRPA